MNTIAILTKLFPKSVATIQQQAINDYRESNENNCSHIDEDEPWIDEDHDRLAWDEEQHQEHIHTLRAVADQKLAVEYPEYYQEYLAEYTQDPPPIHFDDYLEYRRQLEEQQEEFLSTYVSTIGNPTLPMDYNMIEPSDRIHLYSKRGVYTVVRKRDNYITLTAGTLNGKTFVVPISDVKCFYDHNRTMKRKLLKL